MHIRYLVGRVVVGVVIASYSIVSFAQATQLTTKMPAERKRALSSLSCMQRLSISESGATYQSLSGNKVTWETSGKKVNRISNGSLTATARYDGDSLVGANLSDGRVMNFRKNLTSEEHSLLPQKIKRLKRLMSRLYAKECSIGTASVSAGKFIKTAGEEEYSPDEWDPAWETEEFWVEYLADTVNQDQYWVDAATLPKMTCIIVEDGCIDSCDTSVDVGMLGCGAMGSLFGILNPLLGIALATVCGAGMLVLKDQCHSQCAAPRIECY